jgi:hypothetical protein
MPVCEQQNFTVIVDMRCQSDRGLQLAVLQSTFKWDTSLPVVTKYLLSSDDGSSVCWDFRKILSGYSLWWQQPSWTMRSWNKSHRSTCKRAVGTQQSCLADLASRNDQRCAGERRCVLVRSPPNHLNLVQRGPNRPRPGKTWPPKAPMTNSSIEVIADRTQSATPPQEISIAVGQPYEGPGLDRFALDQSSPSWVTLARVCKHGSGLYTLNPLGRISWHRSRTWHYAIATSTNSTAVHSTS